MESILKKEDKNTLNLFHSDNNMNNTDDSSKSGVNNLFPSFKKKLFDVDEIIEKCKEKNGIELLNFMCSVMHEKKRNMLESLYKELGKGYLIAMLEKALNIENSGGLNKGKNMYGKKNKEKVSNENNSFITINNEKKSTGGIFFALIKRDPEAKDILNRVSKLDWKESKQRKKVYKLMNKLNI